MLTSLLQDFFLRFGGASDALQEQVQAQGACPADLAKAVEHVVDTISGRLRVVPNYERILLEPVVKTFRHIDQIADSIPGPLPCCRSAFNDDPRINAFFVSPRHIQEVFSQSDDVRRLFEANPLAAECYALMCVRREERSQLGMALVNNQVRNDVLQTSVNFTDHHVISPGTDEVAARCALKCCMFDGLLAHIKRRAIDAAQKADDLETRLRVLHSRLKSVGEGPDAEQPRAELSAEIRDLEDQLAGGDARPLTINEQLDMVAAALSDPAEYLTAEDVSLRLSRMAIKLEQGATEPGYELSLSEIRIASHRPRVGALVRFPREELLPQQDFVKQADLFLSL
jgi:hypothetical protein